jgi:PadR family transcriptional regulator
MARRPSPQTVAVLALLARDPAIPRYGYELGKELGLKAGTLSILMRLCDRGFLEASWETDPPPGRPPRHLYRIVASGLQLLDKAQEISRPVLGGTAALGGAW